MKEQQLAKFKKEKKDGALLNQSQIYYVRFGHMQIKI